MPQDWRRKEPEREAMYAEALSLLGIAHPSHKLQRATGAIHQASSHFLRARSHVSSPAPAPVSEEGPPVRPSISSNHTKGAASMLGHASSGNGRAQDGPRRQPSLARNSSLRAEVLHGQEFPVEKRPINDGTEGDTY